MNKSSWFILLGILVLVASFWMSEDIVKEEPRKDGRVIVTYWEKWTNFEADAMRAVVDDFNKSQDKIWVEYLSVSGITQKTLLATAAGVPPDLAGLASISTVQYAFHNALTPLDEWAEEAGIKREDYVPVYYDLCTYQGDLYALPTTPATIALHYNKDHMKEVGWDANQPPKTFEELDELAERLETRSSGEIRRMGFLPTEPNWWPWAWGYYFGGEMWDGKSQITMTDPQIVKAYEWVQGYGQKYGFGNMKTFGEGFGGFDSPQNAFFDGKVSMVQQGVWMFNFIEKNRPNMDWGASLMPYPADHPELQGSALVDLDIIVIPKGAKHPKEAFEFLRYTQTQAAMEKLCLGQKKQSPLVNVSDSFYENHPNPYIELFADLAKSENAFYAPRSPVWQQWASEISAALDGISQGKDVKDELQSVQDKMQPILDEVYQLQKAREKDKQ